MLMNECELDKKVHLMALEGVAVNRQIRDSEEDISLLLLKAQNFINAKTGTSRVDESWKPRIVTEDGFKLHIE